MTASEVAGFEPARHWYLGLLFGIPLSVKKGCCPAGLIVLRSIRNGARMQECDRKIRVCFVMPKTYPLFNPSVEGVFGGAEVDLYYLSTELAKDERFDVSFVVADYGQEKVEQIENVRVIKSLTFKENPVAGAQKIWGAMKEAGADVYFLETASPGVPLAQWFCSSNEKKLVYRTAHLRECDGSYLKQKPLVGRAYLWAVRNAGAVVTQNESDREMFRETTGVNSIVIPNGQRMPELGGKTSDCVLWVGRSVGFKRTDVFLELAKRCGGQRFVMICQKATGDDKYEELKAAAGEIENLEFIERVGFHEIDKYFLSARAYVNTSDAEGFPNVFIQACKAAVPILSLNVNPDGFLDKYECGKCYGGDVEKMSRELGSLDVMLGEGENGQMGANGRRYVEERHDITKIVERYKEIFIELAGGGEC